MTVHPNISAAEQADAQITSFVASESPLRRREIAESLIRVPETQSVFHPHAQQDAYWNGRFVFAC
jgi:hypothetical protein